ncbi:MAG: LysM peptidoglycan-binding domain-containing protein [Chloroflexota bacterium]|nr:LysM peptidoglycan-binding domain-containing protein [Chloroflexota bacterium]
MVARKPRILIAALIVAVMISVVPASGGPMASVGDLLYNGGFEHGFVANQACGGMVGAGWGCFNNGGVAEYGYYDDMWDPVVYAGEHSQLIEINTKEMGGDNDRNAGIFQRVAVWPGTEYELSLKGMIRADDHGGDPWRYRVYVGFDYYGGTDWQAVTDWREMPWDDYYDRLSPGAWSGYSTKVAPSTDQLTVFVRVQRKWGTWYEETDVNLDAISLFGPVAAVPYQKPYHDGGYHGDPKPVHPPAAMHPPVAQPPIAHPPVDPGWGVHPPKPHPEPAIVCDGPNLLMNGGFEYGFQANGVANYWMGFNNGGRANYGYYDEQWPPVVSEGTHGQLIEINTLDVGDQTDPDRMSGIYQWLWLKPGATYEFSVDAMMRERNDHSDEDFYRYMVEWGYSANGWTDPANMTFRERVPLDNIYLRTEPGEMQSYTTRFAAPSETTTIWLFALKKWATLERELDANLDNVAIRMCRTPEPVHPIYPIPPIVHPIKPIPPVYPKPCPPQVEQPTYPPDPGCPVKPVHPIEPGVPGCTTYHQVQRGDTLSGLAQQYGTTVQAIMAANNLTNPNYIYVGQKLCIPGQSSWDESGGTSGQAGYQDQGSYSEQGGADANSGDGSYDGHGGQTDHQYSEPQQRSDSGPVPTATETTVEIPGSPTSYRVQRGDTLSGIAQQFNTTVEALMALNDIANPNFIYVGQSLRLG